MTPNELAVAMGRSVRWDWAKADDMTVFIPCDACIATRCDVIDVANNAIKLNTTAKSIVGKFVSGHTAGV